MIRTKTTFILGHGASAELHMPGPAELLERIAQALDFSRASASQMTRDTAAILRHVAKLAEQAGQPEDALFRAAQRIHSAAKVARTIEDVIEQNDDDPTVGVFGKLALAVFTMQSEARSSVRAVPQPNTPLPLQTGDYWLLELGKLITAGLPRSRLEAALEDVTIVSFTYDRAAEHVLPYILATAYGMTLQEAQRIVSARLKVYHPLGSVGRLPWQAGSAADVDWGNETPWNMAALSAGLRTGSEAAKDREGMAPVCATVAASQRLVFLGFDFAPQSLDLLIEGSLSHNPELVVSLGGLSAPNRAAALRLLARKAGVQQGERILVSEGKCLELLKDYGLQLES